MAKLEDYSLPYDEAKKKYGHNGYFMSKDQYEFNKAAAEKQAKMKAAEEAGNGNWWEQKGEADRIIEDRVGKENPTHEEAMAKIQETAEQRLTPEQQGVLAKGNKGDDHINNPNEADTADLEKVQQAREKLFGQKDSYTPEEIEAAKNEAGITKEVPGSNSANNALTDSVAEVTTPKKDDPPVVGNSKNQYNKAMMSIWDAYRAGEISKETAGYFTIDAIATLAKNLGRSIGNVGAQFSGGTIDNGHDESKWGQRQDALLNEAIGIEKEGMGGAAERQAESENIANLEARIRAEYSPQMLENEIKKLENEVKLSGIDVTKAENSQALIEHIKQDPDYENKPLKLLLVGFLSQTGVGGAVNSGASALEKLALLRGK